MPILWWIWIHNIQERCLLGKDFSLLKAPSFTPSESINISKGRIILIIDNIQYVSMSKLKTSFRCRVPRTGYGGVAAVWWTRGVVLVGAIFFFTGCFIGACSRAAPLSAGRDRDLVTPPVTLLATRLLRQHQHRPLPLTNYTSLTPVLVSTSL